MFKIALNKMYLTRGDTARFSITLDEKYPNDDYVLSDKDKVYFIVTEFPEIVDIEDLGVDPTKYIFYKEGLEVIINPEDTMDLEDDTYYYQVRAILNLGGDVNTLIEPQDLFLTPRGKVMR